MRRFHFKTSLTLFCLTIMFQATPYASECKPVELSDRYNQIVKMPNGYLAVGSPAYLSEDGINWSEQDYGGFWCITDGPRILLLNYQKISHSTDGIHWQTIDAPSMNQIHWDGQYYIGYDEHNYEQGIFRSSDGLTWTELYEDHLTRVQTAVSGGGQIAVIKNDRLILNDMDGHLLQTLESEVFNEQLVWYDQAFYFLAEGWIGRLENGSLERFEHELSLYQIEATNNGIVAIGSEGMIMASTNGHDWQQTSIDTSFFGLTTLGNHFGLRHSNGISRSHNGLQWEHLPAFPHDLVRGLWGDEERVFIKNRDGIITYKDGWTFLYQAYSNKVFHGRENELLLYKDGYLISSEGDDVWYSWGLVPDFDSLVWFKDRYFAIDDQMLYSSEDKASWEPLEQLEVEGTNLMVAGDRLFMLDNQRAQMSQNGLEWVETSHPMKKILFANNMFLGINGTLFRSLDGITWESLDINAGRPEIYTTIGNRFIQLKGRYSHHSSDGIHWYRSFKFNSSLNRMMTNGESLFLVSSDINGLYVRTRDGIHWTMGQSFVNGNYLTGNRFYHYGATQSTRLSCLSGEVPVKTLGSVIPWVVNNEHWSSRIALYGGDYARLVAVTKEGERQELEVALSSNKLWTRRASDLFPNLSGYSLYINSPHKGIYPSFVTYHHDESGIISPSQTTGIFTRDIDSTAVFGYVPGDQVAAIVVVAPGMERLVPITMTLMDDSGVILAERDYQLQGDTPFAQPVQALFEGVTIPESAAVKVIATDGTHITGTTFVFNEKGQPSMSSAFAPGLL